MLLTTVAGVILAAASVSGTPIVGGKEIETADIYPWMVTLRARPKAILERFPGVAHMMPYIHFCGGSMIAENLILTAAHCVDANLETIEVVASIHRYDQQASTESENGIDFKVIQYFKLPDWNGDFVRKGDIAVLVVEPINPSGKALNIPYVSFATTNSKPAPKDIVTIAGWGRLTHGGRFSRFLKSANVPVLSIPECKKSFTEIEGKISDDTFITELKDDKHICVGDVDQWPQVNGPCHGDSGGPLFTIENGKPVVYGITSYTHICGDSPAVYARVATYANWLVPIVEKYGKGRFPHLEASVLATPSTPSTPPSANSEVPEQSCHPMSKLCVGVDEAM
ncbi:Hyaluronan-binding protein 2 [Quaeritorhiza haematococci]|nr:Hyaluronan-binding protein 2 [Quaeritorhiza haematococci]